MSNNPRRANSTIRNKQRAYWKARGLPCGICGKAIDYSLGYIKDPLTGKRRMHPMAFVIDEIIPVSRGREGGYSSPEACALGVSNQRPAHYIGNARGGSGTRDHGCAHIVIGAPCSGKTTFVKANASATDIIIDLDAIAKALGYPEEHGVSGNVFRVALAARQAAVNEAMHHGYSCWIIHTAPSDEQLSSYKMRGAIVHVIDPGIDECLRRASADARPQGTEKAIRDWYSKSNSYSDERSTTDRDSTPRQPFDDW